MNHGGSTRHTRDTNPKSLRGDVPRYGTKVKLLANQRMNASYTGTAACFWAEPCCARINK
jgi:hypothetical protein